MIINEVKNEEWALDKSTLEEMTALYDGALKGEGLEQQPLNFLKLYPARPAVYEPLPNAGVINICGLIARRIDNLLNNLGGVSTLIIAKHFMECLNSPHIKEIYINCDSPGGAVAGTQSLANLIFECRGEKPIIGICDGQVLSAAYWIAAACDKIFISCDTVKVGSIGVVSKLKVSKEKIDKYLTQEFTSAKFKLDSEDDEEIENYKTASLKYTHNSFLRDISKFRNLSMESLEPIADGRVFRGRQVIENGLADGFYDLTQWHQNGKVVERSPKWNA